MCFGSLRYARVPEDKSHEKEIRFFDFKSLYLSMQYQYLPTGNFKVILPAPNVGEMNDFALKYDYTKEKGYYLICDGYIPDHLHRIFNDFPLFCELISINPEQYPDNSIWKNKPKSKVKKLIPHLMPVNHYTCSLQMYQLLLVLGVCFTKIHHLIEFDHSPFLKDVIERMQKLREHYKSIKDTCGSNLAKMLANSLFGNFSFAYLFNLSH